ncbi:MAG: hypothetical protein A2146_07345 [Actinobacteria bacterium RBG_16_67_10]|nr:MAG: hypothetical protein A2146_07345 [Actinobacteria bacterium RBG_16_67_10]
MSLYLALKLVHILLAMVAVGTNFSYAFWLRLAGNDRDRIAHTLESIHRLDMWLAKPAYVIVLLAGIGMVVVGPYPITTPWILLAIVLYVLVALLGITLYAPAVRRQRAAALADPDSDDYRRAARRSNLLGLVAVAIVTVIVFLMVLKPGF